MVRTPSQAIAKALTITHGYGGMCLAFVQDCFGATPTQPSAIACWNSSPRKHPATSTNGIPVGAPIFFAPHGSPYGHVALYLGGGIMRTTNSATGRIHSDPVSLWTGTYGYRLLGWTGDIEGQDIPGLAGTAAQQKGTDMVTEQEMKAIAAQVWSYVYGQSTTTFNYLTNTYDRVQDARKEIAELKAQNAGLSEALKTLATNQGADPTAVAKAVSDAVSAKLKDLKISVES